MLFHRDILRQQFLKDANADNMHLDPMHQDASFRRYFRLSDERHRRLLMDAPPPQEDLGKWIDIASHLTAIDLRPPKVFNADQVNGFALIEDFGDNTFTKLLNDNEDPESLYGPAIDLLVHLHKHQNAVAIDIPPYDLQTLMTEANLLTDWFLPVFNDQALSSILKDQYTNAWSAILSQLPSPAVSLVLRDFHVDNLMLIPGDTSNHQIGLLDFQDARIGPIAYDIVSLLEDARRDIAEPFASKMLERYTDAMPLLDMQNFKLWYCVLAAQRHCKVLGIFSRLAIRDHKTQYLAHLTRVLRLLQKNLEFPVLAPLKEWLDQVIGDRGIPVEIDLVRIRATLEIS